ncbi:hypothetical protein [Burkholderia cenocepacia]|uniref:hypothetical protein n=1 Tax=Burkholderia cenocepacia TaxID=95486 RepID=UPI00223704DA|nr:hypothetical protein [Burkholderia cenocepacia]MCW5156316.1 hypothetical protein [Burkholderia cenocepacia]
MEEKLDDIQMPLAPTLQALKAYGSRLTIEMPQENIICSRCPKAMWQVAGQSLICFCRVMHCPTWTTEQPGDMTLCDGAVEKDDKK